MPDLDYVYDETEGEEEDHVVPPELIELYEILEWQAVTTSGEHQVIAAVPEDYFYTRAEWGARPAKSTASSIRSEGQTAHYEGPHMGTFSHASCATKVRAIQNFHMDSRGWSDIAYNFVVCPHGYVFEGRGQGRRSAANGTNDGNSRSEAVCALIGDKDPTTPELLHGFWIAFGLCRTKGSGSKLWGHRQWKATACPGDPLFTWVSNGAPDPGGVQPPYPEEEEVYAPVPYVNPKDNALWVFQRGTDGALWGKCPQHIKNNDGWKKFGGVITSGPGVTGYPNGEMTIAARGQQEKEGKNKGQFNTFLIRIDHKGNVITEGTGGDGWINYGGNS